MIRAYKFIIAVLFVLGVAAIIGEMFGSTLFVLLFGIAVVLYILWEFTK